MAISKVRLGTVFRAPLFIGALLGLGVLGLAGWAMTIFVFQPGQAPAARPRSARIPPDPRLSYEGPFRNVHPDVKYVGSEKCAACHADIARSYAHHPMARTLIPIEELSPSQQYDRLHHNPFEAFGSVFEVKHEGGRVWHTQTAPAKGKPVFQAESEVHYAIGSGSHGHSYLSNRGGYLFQTPVSWFSQKQIWDQSPGFSLEWLSGRPIGGACLFCHSNRAQSIDEQLNRYAEPIFPDGCGIGCERCHGPGEKHIAAPGSMTAAGGLLLDPTIVHPGKLKKLDPELCEAICRQCHLTGEQRIVRHGRTLYDYRPGLPLDSFIRIFVVARKADDSWHAVNQVEQMYLSKCFQGTSGAKKLGCISCHDPHVHIRPEKRFDFYRSRCLACHDDSVDAPRKGDQGTPPRCSLPLPQRLSSHRNSCIDCHMPRYAATDVVHNASTDHRILARYVAKPGSGTGTGGGPASEPLVPFPTGEMDRADPELARDFGLALAGYKSSPHFAVEAVQLLEAALQADPDDVDAWERKGIALLSKGSLSEGLAAFQTALAKAPRRELAMSMAAKAARNLGEHEVADAYFRGLIVLNPWNSGYRAAFADMLATRGNWEEAAHECQAWLKIDPGDPAARKLRIRCLLHQRRAEEARNELSRLEALQPSTVDQLRGWFEGETKK